MNEEEHVSSTYKAILSSSPNTARRSSVFDHTENATALIRSFSQQQEQRRRRSSIESQQAPPQTSAPAAAPPPAAPLQAPPLSPSLVRSPMQQPVEDSTFSPLLYPTNSSSTIPAMPPTYGATITEGEIASFMQSRRNSFNSSKMPGVIRSVLDAGGETSLLTGGTIQPLETTYNAELKKLVQYSAPLIVTFLLQYSLTVASVFSVGQLGKTELAAVSLASMTANVSAYTLIQGSATALDTLCPQSYGRGDLKMVGVHFLRCTYFLLLLLIPVGLLWCVFAKPILEFLVDDKALCELASTYLRTLFIGLPGFIVFENLKHYLQAQGIFEASTYVLIVCAPINIFLNYFLVWNKHIGMGFIGAPIAVSITNWLMASSLLAYTFFIDGYQCWCGFTKEALVNWSRMLNLAGPGVLMVEAEWLAFEIITFAASKFGTVTLAAQSVVSTTCVLLYQIPFAVGIASSTRIAWYIGSGSKRAAIIATKTSMVCSVSLGLFNAAILSLFRFNIASLFSSDIEVISLAGKVLIIGALYQINDCLNCITAGALRGQGRQKIGGYLNLFSYYCLALPVGFFCGFEMGLELYGLWIGLVVALFFTSLLQGIFVMKSDWDYIIEESKQLALLDRVGIEEERIY